MFRYIALLLCAVVFTGIAYNAYAVSVPLTEKEKELLGSPDDYKFLCSVSDKGCSSHITQLNPKFAKCLAAYLRVNPGVRIFSGYRSVEHQRVLFRQAVLKYGSVERARKWVAPPGRSMHNKGLAADLRGAGRRAHATAPQFGLRFRMAHESWHIEPIGDSCNSGAAAEALRAEYRKEVGGGESTQYQNQETFSGGEDGPEYQQYITAPVGAYPDAAPGASSGTYTPYQESGGYVTGNAERAPYDQANAQAEIEALRQQNTTPDGAVPNISNGLGAADSPATSQTTILPNYDAIPTTPVRTTNVSSKTNVFQGGLPGVVPPTISVSSEQPFERTSGGSLSTRPTTTTPTATAVPARITCPTLPAVRGDAVSITWRCPAGTTSRGESTRATFATDGKRFGVTKVRVSQSSAFTVYCEKEGAQTVEASCSVRVTAPQVRTTTTPTQERPLDTFNTGPQQKNVEAETSQPQTCFLGFCL